MSVLLFHAGGASFSGGCVGVDVFFVISGFLITRLIKDEVESGLFQLRRILRATCPQTVPGAFRESVRAGRYFESELYPSGGLPVGQKNVVRSDIESCTEILII
jgi:hypothetical protein